MSAMADLGVTAVIEIPPAGTLTGLVKRALPGVETLAVKTPDDLPAAWKLINEHGRPANMENQPTWRLLVAPDQGHLPVRHRRAPRRRGPVQRDGRHRRDAARHDPRGRSARRHRRRVARRGRRPGRPRPAHRAPAPHRPGDALMSATITPSFGAPFARILSVAGYRPERIVTNAEICERIDSSDEWIRERSGIIERRFAAHDESVVDMASDAATSGARQGRHLPRPGRHGDGRHGDPPVPDPVRGGRGRRSHRRQRGGGARPGGCLRGLLLRPRAGQRHHPRRQRPLRGRHRRREAQRLGEPRGPRLGVHLRRRRGCRRGGPVRGARPSARSSGDPTAPRRTPSR